jgi:2'-5' RNA ligase
MRPALDPTRRLFIGLFPDAAVRAAIDAHRGAWSWPVGVRLTHPSRIHMTLHFLGEVEAAPQAALEALLAEVRIPRLTLTLRTPQAWRNGIAVLLCDEHEALRALHEDIGRQVERAGLATDHRPWVPHLTIARRTARAVPPAGCKPIVWSVEDFVLAWSRAQPLRYEALARYRARE